MIEEILHRKPVETEILWPWELPSRLEGPAVVFDVVVASANIAILVSKANHVFLTTNNNVRNALKQIPCALLVGETDDEALYKELAPRFAATNSPANIINAHVEGKDVILISNNGTHTIAEVLDKGASPVIAGSYVNLRTVTQWLLEHPDWTHITLVPAGGREQIFSANPKLPEDISCARVMRDFINGDPRDIVHELESVRGQMKVAYSRKPPSQSAIDICLTPIDTYPVVPVCDRVVGGLIKAAT